MRQILLAMTFLIPAAARAATLAVGPSGPYTTIAAAVAASHAGDTISIEPGTYPARDVKLNHDITITATPGTVFIVPPPSTNPKINLAKGLFVSGTVESEPNVTIHGLDLSGAKSGAGNGAGIRMQSGNLTVSNTKFHDNQDGILATPFVFNTGVLTVTKSMFDHNGVSDAQGHGMYIGYVNTFEFEGNVAQNAIGGHEVKSRAFRTVIRNNVINDTPTGTSSYLIDLPDGGNAIVQGNTLTKGPKSATRVMIHLGGGEGIHPNTNITISGNKLVNDYAQPENVTAIWNQVPRGSLLVQDNTMVNNDPGVFLLGMGVLADNRGVKAPIANGTSTMFSHPDATTDLRGTSGPQTYTFTRPGWTVQAGVGHLTATTEKPYAIVVGGAGGVGFSVNPRNGGSEFISAPGSSNRVSLNASAIIYCEGSTDIIDVGATGLGHISADPGANVTVNTASKGTTNYYVFSKMAVHEHGGYLDAYQIEPGGVLTVDGTVKANRFNGQGGTVNFSSATNAGSISGYFEAGSDQAVRMSIQTWPNHFMTNRMRLTAGDYRIYLTGGGSVDASSDSGTLAVYGSAHPMAFIAGSGNASINTGRGPASITLGAGTLTVSEPPNGPPVTYHVGANGRGALSVRGYAPGKDHLVFGNGVGVARQSAGGGALLLQLSNGGTVSLGGAKSL